MKHIKKFEGIGDWLKSKKSEEQEEARKSFASFSDINMDNYDEVTPGQFRPKGYTEPSLESKIREILNGNLHTCEVPWGDGDVEVDEISINDSVKEIIKLLKEEGLI